MAKRFAIPFAATGDKTATPDATAADGSISYSQGWGARYQLPNTDPNYLPVGRKEMNGMFNDVTDAIGEMQLFGFPVWVQPGGLIVPYPINATVRHANAVWRSTIANNSDVPGGAGVTSWVNASLEQATEAALGGARVGTQAQVDSSDSDIVIVTPKKLRWGVRWLFSESGYIVLPTWLGGFIIQWGQTTIGGSGVALPWPTVYPNRVLGMAISAYSDVPFYATYQSRNNTGSFVQVWDRQGQSPSVGITISYISVGV